MKKIVNFVLLLFVSILVVGCGGRPSITLRVLDEQTKEPIEGVVAIAWTTSSHGAPGLMYHKTAEVAERVSGPDGKLTFPSFSTRTIPQVKVYKPGYVGWDNFGIYKGILFEDIKRAHVVKRKAFEYKSQDIFLEPWKEEYSHYSHDRFLMRSFPDDHKDIDDLKSLFSRTVNAYELPRLRDERKRLEKRDGK